MSSPALLREGLSTPEMHAVMCSLYQSKRRGGNGTNLWFHDKD